MATPCLTRANFRAFFRAIKEPFATCMWSWPGLWDASVNVLVPRFRNVILFRLADQKVVELLTFAHCRSERPWRLSSSGPLFAMWSFVFRHNLISLSRSALMFGICGRGWTD